MLLSSPPHATPPRPHSPRLTAGSLYVEWIASDSAQCKGPFKAAELYSSRLGTCCNGAEQNVKAVDGTYCREYMGPSDEERSSYVFGWVLIGICGCCVFCVCAGCVTLCVVKLCGAIVDGARHRDMRERRMSNIGIDGIVRDANGNEVGARRRSSLREQLQAAGIAVRPDGGVALVAMNAHGGSDDDVYGGIPVALPVATVVHADGAGANGGSVVHIADAHVVVPPQLSATRALAPASSVAASAPATACGTGSAARPSGGARGGAAAAAGDGARGPRRESINPLRVLSPSGEVPGGAGAGGRRIGPTTSELSFMYRYISHESCSQFDSLPLTSL